MLKLLSLVVMAALLAGSSKQLITAKTIKINGIKPVLPIKTQWWTDWFDRDDPSGTGDWELLSLLLKQYPGKLCTNPIKIMAQTTSGLSVTAARDVIHKYDTTTGFVCRNSDQKCGTCKDYRVRFLCPASCGSRVCWTDWFDRDNPGGTGDWELLSLLLKERPGKLCSKPLKVEAVTVDTLTPAASTGETFLRYDTTHGFACQNAAQKDRSCRDYKVRFGCPC